MIDELLRYLAYPFVRYALAAGVLIALSAALLGVPLVLRRLSFIGDGLSHVAFGAMAVAGVLNFAGNLTVSLVLTIACSIVLALTGRASQTKGDAALAMLSVGAMAAGYMLMNLFPASSNVSGDVCTTLFGSTTILTLTSGELWTCVALSVAVIAFQALTYHRSFEFAFDEDFARASGGGVTAFNLLSAVVVAVVIVVSMRLVGTLLVSALLVFPAVSALRVCRSYLAVTLCAAVLAVVGVLAGMLAAIVAGTPVGATVVMVNLAVFAICYAIGKIRG